MTTLEPDDGRRTRSPQVIHFSMTLATTAIAVWYPETEAKVGMLAERHLRLILLAALGKLGLV